MMMVAVAADYKEAATTTTNDASDAKRMPAVAPGVGQLRDARAEGSWLVGQP
jgi:hypothetical protein